MNFRDIMTLVISLNNSNERMKHPESSGNVLFLILIAVALFAALSYAVTSSSKSGGSGISKDKAKIAASQILQYATAIEQAITRIKVINGCNDKQVSFERAPFDGSDTGYLNPNSPADKRCHVFHPDGGGQSYRDIEQSWLSGLAALPAWHGEFVFSGKDCVPDIGSGQGPGCWNNGTRSDSELIIALLDVNEEICNEINRQFDLSKADSTGFGNFYSGSTDPQYRFKGTYGNISATTSGHIADAGAILRGQTTACFYNGNAARDTFYHVLIAR